MAKNAQILMDYNEVAFAHSAAWRLWNESGLDPSNPVYQSNLSAMKKLEAAKARLQKELTT